MPRRIQNIGTAPSEEAQEQLDDIKSVRAIRRMKKSTKGDWTGDDIRREIARLRRSTEEA